MNAEKQHCSLMCIDMAYTYKTIKATNRAAFCESRHFLGVFDRVYAVHPMADVSNNDFSGNINIYKISPKQVILEGCAFKYKLPEILKPLNLLFSQMAFFTFLIKIVKTKKISAIYATDPYYAGLFGLMMKFLTGRRLVILVAGNYDEIYEATGTLAYPKLFRYRFIENVVARIVLTFSDLVAGGNENNRRCAINHGAKPSRTTVFASAAILTDQLHRNPIKNRNYSLLQTVFKDSAVLNNDRLLVIGRLMEVKLPKDALFAMKIVMNKNPNVIGVFAGDGPLREYMVDWVNSNGLMHRIFFAGNIDQQTLSALIPSSIVLSPLTGLALIEAGLGGAAIVAYNRDWQSDFIEDGIDGFIVPFKDYAAMAEKALCLIDNPELRQKFSENIRRKSLHITSLPDIKNHFHTQWARVI